MLKSRNGAFSDFSQFIKAGNEDKLKILKMDLSRIILAMAMPGTPPASPSRNSFPAAELLVPASSDYPLTPKNASTVPVPPMAPKKVKKRPGYAEMWETVAQNRAKAYRSMTYEPMQDELKK